MTHRGMSEGEIEQSKAFGAGLWVMAIMQGVCFLVFHVTIGDGMLGLYIATALLLVMDAIGGPVA